MMKMSDRKTDSQQFTTENNIYFFWEPFNFAKKKGRLSFVYSWRMAPVTESEAFVDKHSCIDGSLSM